MIKAVKLTKHKWENVFRSIVIDVMYVHLIIFLYVVIFIYEYLRIKIRVSGIFFGN